MDQSNDDELIEQTKLNESIRQLDSKLQTLSLQDQLFNDPKYKQIPVINRKGIEIISNEQIRKRYYDTPPILRYKKLPICWENYKKKMELNLYLSTMAGYGYQVWVHLLRHQKIREMKFRSVGLSILVSFLVGTVIVTTDSIFLDEFCDIDSYHYLQNNDRKYLMKELRKKLKGE